MDNQSLRGFLDMVERRFPKDLLRTSVPVDLQYETTALAFELERTGRAPVLVFDRVNGHAMPLVTNVAASRKLLAACLGVEVASPPGAYRDRCQTICPAKW